MAKWERVEQCPRDGSLLRWQHAKSTFYRALTHKAAGMAVQFATLSSQQTLIVSANLVMPKVRFKRSSMRRKCKPEDASQAARIVREAARD
jgi:hypothetical protein